MIPIVPIVIALFIGAYCFMGTGTVRIQGTTARDRILSRFAAAGLPGNLGKAAAVNAYAESAWDSAAVGDHGRSVGLFQLEDGGGLGGKIALPMIGGKPNPADPRFDPDVNIDTVIAACRADFDICSLAQDGADVAELVEHFCREIERPADPSGESMRRRNLVPILFPADVA